MSIFRDMQRFVLREPLEPYSFHYLMSWVRQEKIDVPSAPLTQEELISIIRKSSAILPGGDHQLFPLKVDIPDVSQQPDDISEVLSIQEDVREITNSSDVSSDYAGVDECTNPWKNKVESIKNEKQAFNLFLQGIARGIMPLIDALEHRFTKDEPWFSYRSCNLSDNKLKIVYNEVLKTGDLDMIEKVLKPYRGRLHLLLAKAHREKKLRRIKELKIEAVPEPFQEPVPEMTGVNSTSDVDDSPKTEVKIENNHAFVKVIDKLADLAHEELFEEFQRIYTENKGCLDDKQVAGLMDAISDKLAEMMIRHCEKYERDVSEVKQEGDESGKESV